MNESGYNIWTDGGSRGNPGPSAIGVVIQGPDIGSKEYGEYIGEGTNNRAEYAAVIFALKKLKALVGSEKAKKASLIVTADSELVVRQLSGQYKVKDSDIQQWFVEIWNMRLDFGSVVFRHVPREQNHGADRLVNDALDREASKFAL